MESSGETVANIPVENVIEAPAEEAPAEESVTAFLEKLELDEASTAAPMPAQEMVEDNAPAVVGRLPLQEETQITETSDRLRQEKPVTAPPRMTSIAMVVPAALLFGLSGE